MNRTPFRTRIKFCGLTRAGDVRFAGEAGADAVGFVFSPASPRRIEAREARAMRNALGPLVDAVALFQNNSADEIRDVIRQVRPTLLQFHGTEEDAFCRAFGVPYIKAVGLGDAAAPDATAIHVRYPGAAGFLFDSHRSGEAGGSGKTADWSRIPTGLNKPFMLAGGLTPENVFEAIQLTLPWGVDVSTGIEQSPGIKDGEKMLKFVEAVRRADCVAMADNDLDIDNCSACGR